LNFKIFYFRKFLEEIITKVYFTLSTTTNWGKDKIINIY